MEGWVKGFSFDFDYTRVFVESFMNLIGSRFSLPIGKDLGFCVT